MNGSVMRRVLLGFGVVTVVAAGAWADGPAADTSREGAASPSSGPVAATPAAGRNLFVASPGRMMPPAPAHDVPDDIKNLFDRFFRKDVLEALSTKDAADDAALTRRLMDEAARQTDYPEFVAYVLDHAVYLGSICPDQQTLVYAALTKQLDSGLRSEQECREKMMLVAPKAVAQLPAPQRAVWVNLYWLPDAGILWADYVRTGRFDAALALMKSLNAACRANMETVPEKVTEYLQASEFLADFAKQRQQYEQALSKPGDRSQERAFLAAWSLVIDDDVPAAITHLRQCRLKHAEELAERLPKTGSGRANLDLAMAMAAFADDMTVQYPKMLLYGRAGERLGMAMASKDLTDSDNLATRLLARNIEAGGRSAAEGLPRMLQGRFAPFDATQPAGAVAQETSFFGIGDKASKVVFVVDRSGSMTDSIMSVKHELKRSIGDLKPQQQFLVIFYSSGPPHMMPARRLQSAIEANKTDAYAFIDKVVPIGQTDPKEALNEAFRLQPDVIYLLTDGEFARGIPAQIDQLNKDRKVKVNTICFIYSNGEPMLMDIANKNNGTYKYVGEEDLNSLK